MKNSFVVFVGVALIAVVFSSCSASPYWDQSSRTNPPSEPYSTTPVETDRTWTDYVVVGTVNIRAEPNSSSETKGWLLEGAKIQAICTSDGWCMVPGGYVVAACLGVGNGSCIGK